MKTLEQLYNKYNVKQLQAESQVVVNNIVINSKDPNSHDTLLFYVNDNNKQNTIIALCKELKNDIVLLIEERNKI